MQAEVQVRDGRYAFDFLFGNWRIENRRLRERLKGSTSWEEFDGHATVRPILGGVGNFDEVTFNRETGAMLGVTLRLYDTQTQQWRIYWADAVHGTLDVPVIGTFKGNRGEFYSQEFFEGQAIFCRFVWTVVSPDECRWEQAFSIDGGRTWETNWTNVLYRIP